MKKTLTVVLLLILSFVMVSCKEADPFEKDVIVVFYTNGGTKIETVVNPELNVPIAKPADPIKTGYEFNDWYKEPTFNTRWNFATDVIDKSTTIYAKYDVVHYDITYVVETDESLGTNVMNYTIEQEVFLRNTIKEGYTFNGWYTDMERTKKVDRIVRGSTGDVTLYSKLAFEVLFDSIYLSAARQILVDPNTVIQKTTANNGILNPKRNGFTFGGWYLTDTRLLEEGEEPLESDLVNFDDAVIDHQFKVYAYWIKN